MKENLWKKSYHCRDKFQPVIVCMFYNVTLILDCWLREEIKYGCTKYRLKKKRNINSLCPTDLSRSYRKGCIKTRYTSVFMQPPALVNYWRYIDSVLSILLTGQYKWKKRIFSANKRCNKWKTLLCNEYPSPWQYSLSLCTKSLNIRAYVWSPDFNQTAVKKNSSTGGIQF